VCADQPHHVIGHHDIVWLRKDRASQKVGTGIRERVGVADHAKQVVVEPE
jgi:hypothetical protein